MPPGERVVLDTSAIVSHLLLPDSVPDRAVRKAIMDGRLLVSDATMRELAEVLARRKFDRYVSVQHREAFLRLLGQLAEWVTIVQVVRACRDPRDDKFLELAVNGEADLLVTGDADLLALHPFRGIPILAPAVYLAR